MATTFILTPLPYAVGALEPTVSSTTMQTHHGKHHQKYVEVTNALLAEHEHGPFQTLEAVVRHAAERNEAKLSNNAGQAWNHGFFWQSMTPDPVAPGGDLAQAIADFGGLDALKTRFVAEGVGHFASGWVWIVLRAGKLEVISTHDADTALVHDGLPLLVCDLWEHAYYLDYKQDRKGFLERWLDTVANWTFAAAQLKAGAEGSEGWTYPKPE